MADESVTVGSAVLSRLERLAYNAAYRLQVEDTDSRELAAPGARRSAKTDAMARIIIEVFHAEGQQ